MANYNYLDWTPDAVSAEKNSQRRIFWEIDNDVLHLTNATVQFLYHTNETREEEFNTAPRPERWKGLHVTSHTEWDTNFRPGSSRPGVGPPRMDNWTGYPMFNPTLSRKLGVDGKLTESEITGEMLPSNILPQGTVAVRLVYHNVISGYKNNDTIPYPVQASSNMLEVNDGDVIQVKSTGYISWDRRNNQWLAGRDFTRGVKTGIGRYHEIARYDGVDAFGNPTNCGERCPTTILEKEKNCGVPTKKGGTNPFYIDPGLPATGCEKVFTGGYDADGGLGKPPLPKKMYRGSHKLRQHQGGCKRYIPGRAVQNSITPHYFPQNYNDEELGVWDMPQMPVLNESEAGVPYAAIGFNLPNQNSVSVKEGFTNFNTPQIQTYSDRVYTKFGDRKANINTCPNIYPQRGSYVISPPPSLQQYGLFINEKYMTQPKFGPCPGDPANDHSWGTQKKPIPGTLGSSRPRPGGCYLGTARRDEPGTYPPEKQGYWLAGRCPGNWCEPTWYSSSMIKRKFGTAKGNL